MQRLVFENGELLDPEVAAPVREPLLVEGGLTPCDMTQRVSISPVFVSSLAS